MSIMSDYQDLLERYDIADEDCSKEITEKHLGMICSFLCVDWRQLPSCLDMKASVAQKIDRERVSEDEKERMFFSKWLQNKGSGATYKTLINALLEKEDMQDAESVCKLLQKNHQDSSASEPLF